MQKAVLVKNMIHLQKLGELIVLLGGRLDFKARKHGCGKNWSPNYVKVLYNYDEIINANIEGEHTTIRQYEEHIKCIKDCYITDILKRIVKDEKYHIRFLKDLLKHKCN